MFKSYQELRKEAMRIVSQRNQELSKFAQDELVWMYVQGYIECMQAYLDNERKKT